MKNRPTGCITRWVKIMGFGETHMEVLLGNAKMMETSGRDGTGVDGFG